MQQLHLEALVLGSEGTDAKATFLLGTKHIVPYDQALCSRDIDASQKKARQSLSMVTVTPGGRVSDPMA